MPTGSRAARRARRSRSSSRPDHVIARQGEVGTGFFVVADGRGPGRPRRQDHRPLGPGDFFGELSVLDGRPRVAQVVADEPTTCLGAGDVGLRGRRARAAGGRAWRPARARRAAARAHRSRPTTDDAATDDAPMSATPPAAARHVTFLFTDIEGSTRLEHRARDGPLRATSASGTARSCARRSPRTTAYEQGTEGDSFFVVVPRGARRRSRRRSPRSGRSPRNRGRRRRRVRVRMGLHTGEVERDRRRRRRLDDQPRGPDRGRGPRRPDPRCRDATRALVEGELPDGVTLRDLGEHRLKDLRAPERSAQLVVDGLPDDVPAARARSTPGRTTCRPSSRRSSGASASSPRPARCSRRPAC